MEDRALRLLELTLHNYRCFRDLTLALDETTVLVGSNNAGKSTILDAVARLYTWDQENAPPLDQVFAVQTQDSLLEAKPGPTSPFTALSGKSYVIGAFSELTEREKSVWSPVMEGDVVRFGRLWSIAPDETLGVFLCLVLTPNALVNLVSSGRTDPRMTVDEVIDELVVQDVLFQDLGFFWIPVHEIGNVFDGSGPPVTWPGESPTDEDFPISERLVRVEGPDGTPPSAPVLLRPLMRQVIQGELADVAPALGASLGQATEGARQRVSDAYGQSLSRYLGDAQGVRIDLRASAAALIESLIGEPDVQVARGRPADAAGDAAVRWTRLSSLGAGARRAAAMAVLELYRDQDIWPADRSVMLLIEEPETGLHPGGQRQVARALRDLPTYGVQSIIVTHSPVFIAAAEPRGLRIVRSTAAPRPAGGADWKHEVVAPATLQDAARELGALPADVLLARRFIVVEGISDANALTTWARCLGCPLDVAGVRVVPAGGHGVASTVARFLQLAYEGASFIVVLDNGPDTAKTKMVIEASHGAEVFVHLLRRTEIEAYYSPAAVVEWLIASGSAAAPVDEAAIASDVGAELSKRLLRVLSQRYLQREFDVVYDGLAIANRMGEHEIAEDVKRIIVEAVSE
jgi:energy-coupling factor transporter ATP-binding protein EcfA2